ncbi:MAG: hypothetical protein H6970_07915 [Gammaproteobacteria bacterium]|nr:hypothetical protein [Gammaproteobacteria bacterium]MCP5458044.1 hypothetical protein [Gammaproteobacteria bacterium]
MTFFSRHSKIGLATLLSVALLSVVRVSLGADDEAIDYLQWIEAEAKRQATATPIDSEASSPTLPTETDRLPLGLQRQEDFEQALREHFAGTFAFYKRLSPAGKEQIFQAYQQDNRVSAIREQTLRLLAGDTP